MKPFSSLFVIILCAVLLASCVHYPSYPETWSPISESASSNIEMAMEGIYECRSSKGESGRHIRPALPTFVFPEEKRLNACQFTSVKTIKDGVIEIAFFDASKRILSKAIFKKGESYEIQGNWIRLRTKIKDQSGSGALGVSSQTTSLTITDAGDLIVKNDGYVAGMMLLIPAVAMGHDWVRFARIDNYGSAY